MSVVLSSRPTKSGCNWNALGNPVVYKVTRKDHLLTQVNNNGGDIQVQYNGGDVTAYYEVGNTLYVNSTNGVYDLTGVITASSFSGGNTLVTIDAAYVSAAPAGYTNNLSKRTDYRVEYNFKSIAGIKLIATDLASSFDSRGVAILNASLLKNLLSATWTLPVSVNEADSTGSIEFYLSFQDYYDGALQGSVTNDSADPIHGLLGANQIGSPDGSNMLAYFPGSSSKKFLTRFQLNSALKGLKMWRDWPFTISFIWPDGIGVAVDLIYYDSSDTIISSESRVLTYQGDQINRIRIGDDFEIPTNAKRVTVSLAQTLFVAVAGGGAANSVMSSPDGVTWTIRAAASTNTWLSVAYGAGLFVAVSESGVGNRVMTSANGVTWTSRTSAADNQWRHITFGNSLFVAVAQTGVGNRVMTSTDGITWTSRTSAADNSWSSVVYGNNLFVAVATSGLGNRVMTSPDGITWTIRTSAADLQWHDLTFGNSLFVAVAGSGTGNRVMTSPDGITWTSRTSAADNEWESVTYGNGLFVAVASTGTGDRVMTSPDGVTWTIRASAADEGWNEVTFLNGLFVAVANSGTGNRVMTSIDGITWTIRVSAADDLWFGVAGSAVTVSETLSIEVDDACEYDEDNLPIPGQNPIMLQWKNSLGGDAQWLFPFYNETSYNLKGRKAKRIILFDQDLSAVQWEALQELISTNEVYSPPIIDLENTNTINYTSKQVGKQVYMIDQDGNKTGVIVIPNSDRINARDPSHRIAIEIELPETQDV